MAIIQKFRLKWHILQHTDLYPLIVLNPYTQVSNSNIFQCTSHYHQLHALQYLEQEITLMHNLRAKSYAVKIMSCLSLG